MRPATDPAAPVTTSRRAPRYAANATLGMALFVFTEAMLFAGFISAFVIVRSSAVPGAWPPLGQPRLPVERTAINTVALLLSGVALAVAGRRFKSAGQAAAAPWMGAALALGLAFVGLQGAEWSALLANGLTLTSSQLGSFFYVIVGAHAVHALGAIAALALATLATLRGRLAPSRLAAVSMFWWFVVLVWPVIYWKVYL